MQQSDGVLAAIQSLAAIYIYDYVQTSQLLQRINHKFCVAEARYSELLNEPPSLRIGKGSEIITISVILSMQDVSCEGRL